MCKNKNEIAQLVDKLMGECLIGYYMTRSLQVVQERLNFNFFLLVSHLRPERLFFGFYKRTTPI